MEKFVPVSLGLEIADAEAVSMSYANGALVLSFIDWKEQRRDVRFESTLAFRWQEFDEVGIRDDACYEVVESIWLQRQAKLQGESPEHHVHYKLCFNACGVLDVIVRRSPSAG